jgi:5-methylcytosine-specific restriction endonuclease McrA
MARSYEDDIKAFRCPYCFDHLTASEVVIDHIMPIALGGSDHPDNLAVLCADCNRAKAALHPDDAEAVVFEAIGVRRGYV